jgi:hypothetical protein
MADLLKPLKVPKGGKDVYTLAETYFTLALTAHYRPKNYECYREYEYMGGSTFAPVDATVSHLDPAKARVLRMLQGSNSAYGFKFLEPKVVENKLKDRGFQKPDFLAFRANDGVIAEIGTFDMRDEKAKQVQDRLRDLTGLVREELKAQSYKNIGRPIPWSGMTWRASDYLPESGPVLIPVDENRVISTEPTFSFAKPGVYLYQLYLSEGHRLPKGSPVALPKLSPSALKEAKDAWQSSVSGNQTPGNSSRWPNLEREFKQIAVTAAEVTAVVLVTAAVVSALPVEAAAGGFALLLAGIFSKGGKGGQA